MYPIQQQCLQVRGDSTRKIYVTTRGSSNSTATATATTTATTATATTAITTADAN